MGWEFITGPNFVVPNAQALPSGATLQTIYNETVSVTVSTATMAGAGNTIPVKTDGVQILTATITPFSSSNKLLIQSVVPIENAAGNNMIVALFQDAITAAIAATLNGSGTGVINDGNILFSMAAGTTGPATFKVNVINFHGFNATWTVNGAAGVGSLGGSIRATLTVQETKV